MKEDSLKGTGVRSPSRGRGTRMSWEMKEGGSSRV